MDATKLIYVAVAVIVLVVVVVAVFRIQNTGKETFNSSSDQLTDQLTSQTTGRFDIYNNSKQSGDAVIRIINETFNNNNIEVVVCTKDGSDFVYNKQAFDSGKVITKSDTAKGEAAVTLSNLPTEDAKGKKFSAADGNSGGIVTLAVAPKSGDDQLMCSTGYYASAKMTAPGYITGTSTYICTVQKDDNGEVRRLTFVQK